MGAQHAYAEAIAIPWGDRAADHQPQQPLARCGTLGPRATRGIECCAGECRDRWRYGRLTVAATAAVTALVAGAITGGLIAILHVLKPEYDPSWRMISEYSLG